MWRSFLASAALVLPRAPCAPWNQGVPQAADLAGWYSCEPGAPRHLLLTSGADGGLRLLDFDTPAFGRLEERDGRYAWRPDGSASLELEPTRGASGAVDGFRWRVSDGTEGRARRDDSYGYAQREVRFRSGEVELCGLLLLPRVAGPLPGAVLIHGSGDSDRDNVWAFTIANALCLHGVAVLFPDKRGSGRSGGDWQAVGFDELADDALAGLEVLRGTAGVDPERIGLVGLSQGGWIAPLAASRSESAAFVASISAAAVPVGEQVAHELECGLRRQGAPEEELAIAREVLGMAFAYGRTGQGWEEYQACVLELPSSLASAFPTTPDDWRWAWYRRVVDFDPLPFWGRLSVPVFVAYGEADERDNVPVQRSVERLTTLARENARLRLALHVYPRSGHALDDPDGTWVRRDFLADLGAWIRASGPRARGR